MSTNYGRIAFTDSVNDVQQHYGSREFYARCQARNRSRAGPDALTSDVVEFLADRDGFYLASVSETGWPYVQFRGGPPGFLRVLDEHTLAWADFRGNLQYISTGNVATNGRVSLFAMDHAHRRRLKLFGHARVVHAEDDPDLVARVASPDYNAVVERCVVEAIEAFDWNCPQHITPRYTIAELEPHFGPLRQQIANLRAENTDLRRSCQPSD